MAGQQGIRGAAGGADLKEVRTAARVLFAEFPDIASAMARHDDPVYKEARDEAWKASRRALLIFEGTLA